MIAKEVITAQQNAQDIRFPASVETAIDAAFDKKAHDIVVLDLEGICSFSDRFLICTGDSVRQTQSIADSIEARLRQAGVRPAHVEGYGEGEWILIDYLDFVVHIFTRQAREFYDLERLWRAGRRVDVPEPVGRPAE